MNFKGHLTCGIIATIATPIIASSIGYTITNTETIMLGAVLTTFGSLYPDTDIKSHSLKVCFGLMIAYLLFNHTTTDLIVVVSAMLIPMFTKHRGLTHNPIFGIIFGIIIGKLLFNDNMYISVCFIVGFMTHLICDIKERKKRR